MAKSRGRRKGSKNIKVAVNYSSPRCPRCGSSDRGKFISNTNTVRGVGEFDGKPYTHIVVRRAKCKCGQMRLERSFEYSGPPIPEFSTPENDSVI